MKKVINVLVIGDVMVDQYLYGNVFRKSPEADIPVLEQTSTIIKAGGAANVALNARLLDCSVTLIGLVGEDEKAKEIQAIVEREGIEAHFIIDRKRPTTVKTRVFNGHEQLVRVDKESTDECSEEVNQLLIQKIKETLHSGSFDIAILQDYNKGVFGAHNIRDMIRILKDHKIFIGVDPKKKHYEQFAGVDLFKPNMNELLHWAKKEKPKEFHKKYMQPIVEKLREFLGAKVVLTTMSEHGIFYAEEGQTYYERSIPVEVVDVCGAGDAVMMVSALCVFSGKTPKETLSLCVKTGKIVCMKVGVSGIRSGEIQTTFT